MRITTPYFCTTATKKAGIPMVENCFPTRYIPPWTGVFCKIFKGWPLSVLGFALEFLKKKTKQNIIATPKKLPVGGVLSIKVA